MTKGKNIKFEFSKDGLKVKPIGLFFIRDYISLTDALESVKDIKSKLDNYTFDQNQEYIKSLNFYILDINLRIIDILKEKENLKFENQLNMNFL